MRRISDDEAAAVQAFMRQLVMLVDVVGKPAPSRLARVSAAWHRGTGDEASTRRSRGAVLHRSTVDDYLRSKRRKLPGWPFVHELLRACQAIAEEDRFPYPRGALGTEAEWHTQWDTARHGTVITTSPIHFEDLGIPVIRVPPEAMPVATGPSAAALADLSTPVDIPDISENPALPTNGTPSAADTVVNEAPLPAAAAPLPVVNEARAEADELPVLTPSPHPPPWRPRQASLSAVLVPEFAEGGSWATVLRWHVEEGTRVSAGDLLVEIMNEMMLTFELSAPVEGVIETIFSYKDQQASPWQPLCTIRRL